MAVEGVQFHPESILTEHGHELLANFLRGESLMDYASLSSVAYCNREDLPHDDMHELVRNIMGGMLDSCPNRGGTGRPAHEGRDCHRNCRGSAGNARSYRAKVNGAG
jgi:hypothetical protein